MTPIEIARFFENFANLLAIRGRKEDAFPIIAYRRAANTFREHGDKIESLIKTGKLASLETIGEKIEKKVSELVRTGTVAEYEEVKRDIPESLLDLLAIPSLGPKKAAILLRELNVTDIPSLKNALKSGEVKKLPGFGKKTAENFEEGLNMIKKVRKRIPRSKAVPIAKRITDYMKKCRDVEKLEIAGSYRRKEETIGDIDILVSGRNHSAIADHFASYPEVQKVLGKGETKISVLLKSGLQVDMRIIDKSCWGAALQYFTGSKAHNVEMRILAKKKGLKISEYGVFKIGANGSETRIAGKTEEDVYRSLGIKCPAPEKRHGSL